jgi:hypothetical protein
MDSTMSDNPNFNDLEPNISQSQPHSPCFSSSSSSTLSISVYEPSKTHLIDKDTSQQMISTTPEREHTPQDSDGHHHSNIQSSSQLTENKGDNDPNAAQQQQTNNRVVPLQHQAAFSPAALLNPKAAKRAAPPIEGSPERGREEAIGSGQVSLVERLHNVHERTASPAKRIKTIEEEEKKPRSSTGNFGSGALDLKKQGDQQSRSTAPAIDLTMSKFFHRLLGRVAPLTYPRRRRRGHCG